MPKKPNRYPTKEEKEHYLSLPPQVIVGKFPPFWTNSKEFRTKWEAREKASLIQGIAWVVGKNVYSVHDMRFIW